MTAWSVILVSEAEKELGDAPPQVRKKFDLWVVSAQAFGPWLKGGWRTEALSGVLKGFYSIRLNRQWRAIFEIRSERKVIVIRIVAHLQGRGTEVTHMKAGRLFEAALKQADMDLKPGTEFKVRVKGKGKHLRLLVAPPQLTEFEAMILTRSQKASDSKALYRPKLSVGETIRALRKTAGLTLEALAGKAGMSKGSLCSIEKGERPAGLAVLKKLAHAMNVPISVLIK